MEKADFMGSLCRSLMGAWIETVEICQSMGDEAVAPLWERGLKHTRGILLIPKIVSLPYGSVD